MLRSVLTALAALLLLATPASAAVADQPAPDISKLDYSPIGALKPGDPLPPAATGCQDQFQPKRQGEIFNPSGKWNAFDNNVFEVLCYPYRAPGDTTDNDPVGNKGATQHGRCGGQYDGSAYGTWVVAAGLCDNHQLEWSRYYAATMKEILGDFGVTIHQYKFQVPDPGETGNTRFGTAINTAAVVPGADNPDETIIVGAHYDKTNDGPASAWDSQEGHAEMIRMAKQMADYWRTTGTRPSATIKFIPWDAEESGTYGSQDYANNNVVPGEESKVRGYWNTDPCAGGYPSYRYGNPLDRLRMGIQLADPGAIPGVSAGDATRITEFNKRAATLVQQVLDRVDDTVPNAAGPTETFISDAEDATGTGDVGKVGGIALGTDRPVLFSSDWRNFETLGIPFFNPGPEVTGPNQESNGDPNYGPDQSADALSTFHTPNDNLQTMMRFTGPDPTGSKYSESWAKGMEFCAFMLSWGMLQPDQGGAQTANDKVVAYYEALPNEAKEDQDLTFDASGSYQYADPATRRMVDGSQLSYSWDFGDGQTGSGREIKHAYNTSGRFTSKLTVTNTATGQSASMSIPITVLPNDVTPPELNKPAATDEDGTFDLTYDYPADKKDLTGYAIEESTNAAVALDEKATSLDRWEVSKAPAGIAPWQLSDSNTAKYHGNLSASKPRSFWTGVPDGENTYQQGPEEGTSILTLKEPVQLQRGTTVALSYQSSFVNDTGDKGRVQIAIDNGDGGQLEWINADSFATGATDSDSLSIFEERQGDQSGAKFQSRFADLTKFAGRKVRLRFVYELGAHDPTFPFARAGWYIDDIKLVSGVFRQIGKTSENAFRVTERTKGTYAYRVKAIFKGDVRSAASNVESVTVTVGGSGDTSGDRGIPVSQASVCATAAGFRTLSVKRRGRGLAVRMGLTGAPGTFELFRVKGDKRKRVVRRTTKSGKLTIRKGRFPAGLYYARLRTKAANGKTDSRTVVLKRAKGKFRRAKGFQRRGSCGLLRTFALGSPGFRKTLKIRLSTSSDAKVLVRVLRGKKGAKVVKRFTRSAKAGRVITLRLRGAKLRRGEYRVAVLAASGKRKAKATLVSRRA